MMVKLVGVLDCLDDQEHAAERNGQRKKPGEHPAPTHLRRVHRQGHRQTAADRSEEHTSELQSRLHLVCRLLLEKKKNPSDDVSHYRMRRTSGLRSAGCPSIPRTTSLNRDTGSRASFTLPHMSEQVRHTVLCLWT